MYQVRIRDNTYSSQFDEITKTIIVRIDAEEFFDSIGPDEELTDVVFVFDDKEK